LIAERLKGGEVKVQTHLRGAFQTWGIKSSRRLDIINE